MDNRPFKYLETQITPVVSTFLFLSQIHFTLKSIDTCLLTSNKYCTAKNKTLGLNISYLSWQYEWEGGLPIIQCNVNDNLIFGEIGFLLRSRRFQSTLSLFEHGPPIKGYSGQLNNGVTSSSFTHKCFFFFGLQFHLHRRFSFAFTFHELSLDHKNKNKLIINNNNKSIHIYLLLQTRNNTKLNANNFISTSFLGDSNETNDTNFET
ncbi:hypothetical protein RFI_36196 [Reticulomyxa filosa]|uniref:Uncharacterized protein n=1 Tax=Reticulomyxa filosa TaxID=46433 RepID=X6LHZ8_RETFI|nr:hypothetical protein RFI_36196 [Reticulomyxa filosa]|eukprot:ETO01244.1 hypothetical protein RFI_36196 [Reticulomyxa filosa]